MAGRPRRIPDPDLAKKFHDWRSDAGLTVSATAGRLGIAPSTLTRSLKTNSFSFDMRGRLKRLVEGKPVAPSWAASAARPTVDGLSIKDLHLLHEFVNLIPKAEAILKSVLDLRAEGEKP
jgi:transcriptional regulator with XRE-family HTH domain